MHKFISNLIQQYTSPYNVWFKDPKWFWATIALLINLIMVPIDIIGLALNWIFFRDLE